MDPNTEIRQLDRVAHFKLVHLLDTSENWKILMGFVLREASGKPKFNADTYGLIKLASGIQRRSGAEIFLEEWATMGRRRPTLQSTLDLLVKAELFRAADYIAQDLLKKERPERPRHGPAKEIPIPDVDAWSNSGSEHVYRNMSTLRLSESDGNKADSDLIGFSGALPIGSKEISDLLVFSSDGLPVAVRPNRDEDGVNNELDTCELPAVLLEVSDPRSKVSIPPNESDPNDFIDPSGYIPVCLNEFMNDSNTENRGELNTSELPQCVANFGHRSDRVCSLTSMHGHSDSTDSDEMSNSPIGLQELPVKIANQSEFNDNQRELETGELPEFVAELHKT